jgi:integrase
MRREYSGDTGLAATPQNMGEATTIEVDALKALQQGRQPNGRIEPKPFAEAVSEFLPVAEARYRAHPSSFKRIKTSLASALEYFGKTPVKLIDAAKIDLYKTWRVQEHEVRDITIRHDLHALSTFFTHAIRHHWAFLNPIKEVDIPSDADAVRIHVLTPGEEDAYFQRAMRFPNLHDVGRIMINQGMRPEEVVGLAKSDINLDAGTIHIRFGKTTAARRTLDMTAESLRIFESRMKGESPWVFPSRRYRGKHIGRINSAHDSIVAEAAKAGIPFNFVPYDFRHTFATRSAESNVDLGTLADLLGHDSIRCVQKYVHISAEHKKSAMKRYDRAKRTRERSRSGRR